MNKNVITSDFRITKSSKPVKGIKDIPGIYPLEPTQAKEPVRKKTWEIHISQKMWREEFVKLNSTEVRILINLGFYARKKTICFPSYRLIMKDLDLNKSTIIKNISSLVKKGFIKKQKTFGKKNVYTLKTPF